MEAKSKYNIGDTIYYMYGVQPRKDVISGISFFAGKSPMGVGGLGATYEVGEGVIDIKYHILNNNPAPVKESDAYATKEELMQSLTPAFDKI